MNTNDIFGHFDRSRKILCFMRSGIKDQTGHVVPECLAKIEKEGIPGIGTNVNCIHWGSGFIRTEETAGALMRWLESNKAEIYQKFPADSRLGNQGLFDLLHEEVIRRAVDSGYTNYGALAHLAPAYLASWNAKLADLVPDLFEALDSGDVCVLPCHTPTVEVIFNLFAEEKQTDENLAIKELESIALVMDEDDHISVARLD